MGELPFYKSKYVIHVIVLIALAIRAISYLYFSKEILPDSLEYLQSGQELWSNGKTGANDMMPLYPLFISLSDHLFGWPLLDVLISSLTVYFVYGIADEIGKNHTLSLIAALFYAFWPMSIFYSGAILTESLFVFLFLGGFYAAYRKQLLCSCIFWVLSLLTRPVFDLLYPILIVVFFYEEGWIKSLKSLAIYFFVFGLMLTPWWIHNYQKYGSFVKLNLGLGYVLYEGNHLQNHDGGPAPFSGKEPYDASETNPIKIDKKLKSAAVEIIKNDPIRFLKMAWKKFLRLWNPFPNHESYQGFFTALVVGIPAILIYVGSFIFMFKANRKIWFLILPIILCVLYLTALHMVTVASIRYRYPVEPLLLILACIGVGGMVKEKYFNHKSVLKPN
ncbi:MAG TPA: hypothetical protein PLY70_01270 [Saprospiraceae bacterium]|nr:hypothetical protein [Saprospiraceae bacterium]